MDMNNKLKVPNILYYSYYTLQPSTASPSHSHTYYEFTYIYECTGEYLIDGKSTKIKKGDTLLFPPGCKHSEIISNADEFNIFVVGFDDVEFKDIPNFYNNFGTITPLLETGEYRSVISECCEEIREEILKGEAGYRQMIKTLIEKLSILLIRSKMSGRQAEPRLNEVIIDYSKKKDVVNWIKYYLDFYYSSNISLENIAQNVYLSPVYIIKLFKDEIGETPISYLINVRIGKAKELLKQGGLSLNEIAQMVGYNDVVHFSKLFKRYTGFSPKQYLKNQEL